MIIFDNGAGGQDEIYNKIHSIANKFKRYIAGYPNVYVMLDDIEAFINAYILNKEKEMLKDGER